MGIEIVQTLPEEQWRSFVDGHPSGNIFQTPEMFEVFESAKGYKPALWAAVRNERPLALFLPVQITLFNGPLQRLTARAVANGGVLSAQGAEGAQALSLLLDHYKHQTKNRVLFTELRNLSDLDGSQAILNQHGFVYEDHLNYLIHLKGSPDEVFERFGRRTRKNIRRGLRQGKVCIEIIRERDQMAEFYRVLEKIYRHARVPLADSSLFGAAFDHLHPRGMLRVTLARVDQVPVAVSLDLIYKGTIYGWYGGSDRAYSAYVPNELVMWHILEWGAENGYKFYDFGGAGTPEEDYGVRDFKAKFGGELVCFGRNTCVYSPRLLAMSKRGYAVLRRFL